MTIEIGMPVYRPSGRLKAVLMALFLQTYKDFFVTIYNDTPPDESDEIRRDGEIVEEMRSKYGMHITLVQNERNLGYMANIHQIFDRAHGDILFLLADDDIISIDCVELLVKSFDDPSVGCVSRPYYWFIDDFKKPVRFCGTQYDEIQKVDLLHSPLDMVKKCIEATGQLSGLGFRRSMLVNMPFVEDMFTAHVYPFLYIFKDHLCAYMPHPTVAVSISTSQCQNDIYSPSPMEQWIRLYKNILSGDGYDGRCDELLEYYVLNDFYGLAQIKNYGTYKELWGEIANYVRYRRRNLLSMRFYVFAIGSLVIPRFLLKPFVHWYKVAVLARCLRASHIDFTRFPFDAIAPLWQFPSANERSHS